MALLGYSGAVIQRSVTSATNQVRITSSGGPHEPTSAFRLSITPRRSNSNLILHWACAVNESGGGRNVIYSASFQRSTDQSSWTDVSIGDSNSARDRRTSAFRPYGYDYNDPQMLNVYGQDAPGGTSTYYYRLVFYFDDGTPDMWFNLSSSDYSSWPWTGRMTFTITEVHA
jgi:hypothetical protein